MNSEEASLVPTPSHAHSVLLAPCTLGHGQIPQYFLRKTREDPGVDATLKWVH